MKIPGFLQYRYPLIADCFKKCSGSIEMQPITDLSVEHVKVMANQISQNPFNTTFFFDRIWSDFFTEINCSPLHKEHKVSTRVCCSNNLLRLQASLKSSCYKNLILRRTKTKIKIQNRNIINTTTTLNTLPTTTMPLK